MSAWLSPDLALAQAKKIIELTNALRQTISLPALLESQKLTRAAIDKASDMALNNYFAHVSPAGLGLANWLHKIGYEYSLAGENLAVGFSRPEDVVAAWKNSPTHYDNIIDRGFKEIGVAVAEGKLNQVNTAFIAQYFGAPAAQTAEPLKETAKKKIIINQQTATLSIKSGPINSDRAIQIETALPADTVAAEVITNAKKIILNKIPDKTNSWRGLSLISSAEEKNISNPLIPASLAVKNSAGTVAYEKVDWDEIKMIKATALEHYRFFKNNPAAAMAPIINLSGLYFKLILSLALIALLLNIFIEIRKQHAHIIFYSFAFLGLLVAMIIF